MMALSALIGAGSGVVGVYASFFMDVASGAAIVLVTTAVFAMVYILVPGRRRALSRA